MFFYFFFVFLVLYYHFRIRDSLNNFNMQLTAPRFIFFYYTRFNILNQCSLVI